MLAHRLTVQISISVVIPAYNRAKTITYCLDSVCNQTVPPFEIIVVDDCSTDETAEVVNNYSRFHPSVRCVVLDRNSGAQAARNRGIVEARGDWIAFQDSDDEWVLDKLEKQIAVLAKVCFDPLTVVHSDCFRFDQQTMAKSLWTLPRIDGKCVHPELLSAAGPMFQGMVTSKVALQKIGLLDENVPSYQEWETSIRLAKVCRFIHLQEPLFVYHFHAGETISKSRKRDVEGFQYVVDKHRDDILRLCDVNVLNQHLEGNALKAIRWGFYSEAQHILAKAIGNSMHIALLKWTAQLKISLHVYDVVTRIARRLHVLS